MRRARFAAIEPLPGNGGVPVRHQKSVAPRPKTSARTVALSLIDYSAIETSHRLRVGRATVYRSIVRLRAAFTSAGFTRPGVGSKRCPANRQEARA